MNVALHAPSPIPFHASAEQLLGTAGISGVPVEMMGDDTAKTVQVRVVATMKSASSSVVIGLARFLPDGTYRTITQVAYAGQTWAVKASPWATVDRPGTAATLRLVGRSLTTTPGEAIAVVAQFRPGGAGSRE